ncbi:MAG TPA: cytidylate kinase-like family protein [Dehalococcoidia bacterium]|nr:cytidylate kinase-like family protein [Dehalococcoidia bacterium]
MPVVTVSGSLASGARELAQAVASELRLDYVDQEILVEAAREMGVSVEAVERHDERPSTLGERLAGAMRTLMERSASAGATDPVGGGGLQVLLARTYGEAAELPAEAPSGQLDDASYLRTLTSVITAVAARGNVVILGRGSQAILQHQPETLHVYVTAPREQRIASLGKRDGISAEDAEKRIRRSDQNREAFHRRYFKVGAENPLLYDLMLHAGRLSEQMMVRLVLTAVQVRAPRPG